ncbi:DUF4852 domain-containing protein [Sneathiella chinensis]|uniref:DUF4852 domain-containing protein n=1 Tax=Sneathiella chinensis TaxID=349750 RepID=A0ABQ5TZW4_9PROT|nr:DUF4852 domain-containing protein [Sneathiella chinensis]GLQ05407.1 hypothetical protein GCM10007924_06280 [Sneathiella chinensis]
MTRPPLRALGVTLALFGGLVSPAASADTPPTHVFAKSSKLGVSIEMDVRDGQWCRKDLSVTVRAKDPTFFEGETFPSFLPKVGQIIDRECPDAETATVTGLAENMAQPLFQGNAKAADGWKPAATADAPANMAKASGTPTVTATPDTSDTPKASESPAPATTAIADPASTAEASGTSENDQDSPTMAALSPRQREIENFWNTAEPIKTLKLVRKFFGDNPALLANDGDIRNYARQWNCGRYRKTKDNEFDLRAYLDAAKADLQENLISTPIYATYFYSEKFKSYDFGKEVFPVSFGGQFSAQYAPPRLACNINASSGTYPQIFRQDALPSPIITELPLSRQKAETLVAQKKYGRKVYTHYLVRIDRIDLVEANSRAHYNYRHGYGKLDLKILELKVYADEGRKQLLHTFTEEDINSRVVAIRLREEQERIAREKAAEEERAQQEKVQKEKELAALRELQDTLSNRLELGGYPARLAFYLDRSFHMPSLSETISHSLVDDGTRQTKLMVRLSDMDGPIATANWPRPITITLPEGLPEAPKKGDWMLIKGNLETTNTAPKADLDLALDVAVEADTVVICTQERCREAEDLQYLMDHAYPELIDTPIQAPSKTDQ